MEENNLMEQDFYTEIKEILHSAREKVYKTANFAMLRRIGTLVSALLRSKEVEIRQNTGHSLLRIFLTGW